MSDEARAAVVWCPLPAVLLGVDGALLQANELCTRGLDVPRIAQSWWRTHGAHGTTSHGRAQLALPDAPDVSVAWRRITDATGDRVCWLLAAMAEVATQSPTRRMLDGVRVLVVDDDVPLARGVGRVLVMAGARAEIVHSASDGLRALESHPPDILVTDFQLGDGDGLALLRRAARKRPVVRAVLVSAVADPALVSIATRMGAGAVVQKPFDPAHLVATIDRVLGSEAQDVRRQEHERADE